MADMTVAEFLAQQQNITAREITPPPTVSLDPFIDPRQERWQLIKTFFPEKAAMIESFTFEKFAPPPVISSNLFD